jgi:hypothetical protein
MDDDDLLIAQLRAVIEAVEDRLGQQPAVSPSAAVATAKRTYRARRLRDRHFPAGLFADPAWDILLDLYVARHEGREVLTSAACIGAAVPATTGLRWLRRLEKEGLLFRRTGVGDARRSLVALSEKGIQCLELVLAKAEERGT